MNYWTRSVPDTLLFTVCFLNASLHGQSETSSLCVAPNSAETPQRCAPGLCDGGKLSLKIDRLPVQSWPNSESIRIDGLSFKGRHRVVIYLAEKAQQSFTFRCSHCKFLKPCLFLNDLYWTAQLWDAPQAPWCKCQ